MTDQTQPRKRGRPRKNPLPEQKPESIFDLVDAPEPEIQQPTPQPKQPKKGVVAIGWCVGDETSPSAGRAVEGLLMAREDVTFDGFVVKEVVKSTRYFGFVIIPDFVIQLQRVQDLKTVWQFNANGSYTVLWERE